MPDGSYYVSSTASYPGSVLHYSASGAYLDTLGANDGTPAPLAVPGTLVFGPNGHLYVGDFGAGKIYQYDTTSATQQYLAADTIDVGYTPGGISFATDGTDDLFVGDLDAQAVFRYHSTDPPTTLVAPGSGLNPAALLAEPYGGKLLIADLDFGFEPTGHHQIMSYDFGTSSTSQFINLTHPVGTGPSAGLPPQPTSMLFDRDGNLLVGLSADHTLDGAVEKFNIDNGALMGTLITGIGTPTGLGFIPENLPADVVDLNGAAGGTGFSNTYDGVTAANVADAANATVNGPGAANLTQMTVAISGTHTGDVLAATLSGGITSTFASGTLTLSGSSSVANYQAVLRTVKYSNTVGPGVDTITINVQGKDATNVLTNTATSTISLPPVLDLNGATTGSSSTSGWFNSGKVGLEGADSGDAVARRRPA